ncbi:VOC family protein [Oceanomicrobium pacificus]|uniref:VOC family protein n=1 Tax=Oceanomicrobium pacificus TaxID=2692916 RepID=A0A6B0TZ20_9RHOB|nr:VOC family protein [Oceanomicrobium pacificus]MXU64151.1 VOC family protein [Oceanomicrobium pacificus]
MPQPKIAALDHLVLTVRDIGATCRFYGDALGMEVQSFTPSDGTVRTALSFGSQKFNLHEAGREFEPKADTPTPGSADFCLLTDASLDDWIAHLSNHGIGIEEGPVDRTGATGPIRSIYMRDPDGNLVEISRRL